MLDSLQVITRHLLGRFAQTSSMQISQLNMQDNILFLINCCKTDQSNATLAQIDAYLTQLNSEQISAISSLAFTHGVYPLVHHTLAIHSLEINAKKTLDELKQKHLGLVVQNMYMAAELDHIVNLFNLNGIQALAFKGPALAQIAYKDITLRQYCDLDILIKQQDIQQAMSLLIADLYQPEIELTQPLSGTFFSCVNVIGLRKKIYIEIHWALLSKNYAIQWHEGSIWTDNETTVIDDIDVPVLSYNHHLLYLCAHGAKHMFERLEWVCDIDRLIRSKPDLPWQALQQQAKKQGIQRIMLLGLHLCQTLFDLPLPENIKLSIQNDPNVDKLARQIIKLNFSNSNVKGKSYSSFGLLWRMRENFPDRLRFAYRALFAPKFNDFEYITLPNYLLFLYPVIRPFRLLIKYFVR